QQVVLQQGLIQCLALTRGCDDVVRVDVITQAPGATFEGSHHSSRGSVMWPVAAAAAHASGDASHIDAVALPMRALKLRFAVDSTFIPSPGMMPLVPQHAPQPGIVTIAPIAASFASVPSWIKRRCTSRDAGVITSCTP